MSFELMPFLPDLMEGRCVSISAPDGPGCLRNKRRAAAVPGERVDEAWPHAPHVLEWALGPSALPFYYIG